MVWPFSRGKESSTASFEKTLSSLAERISKTSVHRDALLSSRRRWKVLWTLYTSFAYLLYTVILVLVTGREHWSWIEYGAIAGGPVGIYAVRLGIDAAFGLRIDRAQRTLDDLSTQRQTAIDKFKKDTQYDSTQKLLEKYGAEKPKPKPARKNTTTPGTNGAPAPKQPLRTGLPPPPTANIQRPLPPLPLDAQQQLQQQQQQQKEQQQPRTPTQQPPPTEPTAEFAPNAFGPTARTSNPAQAPGSGPASRQWYDRLMDVLLGDDETKPSSRLALVCANPQCRLVNGQAPPGVTSLADVGRWRCAECKSWNGAAAGEQGVREMLRDAGVEVPASPTVAAAEDTEDTGVEADEPEPEMVQVGDADTPARSTRSRKKVGGED